MSIKQLVNDYTLYTALMQELDEHIEAERLALERSLEPIKMHQHQGAIRALRRLKSLRDIVNGRQ